MLLVLSSKNDYNQLLIIITSFNKKIIIQLKNY